MKKSVFIVFIFGLSILNLNQTHANTLCIQKTQAAVNPEGQCQTFSTPCDVPENWKAVPACSLIENDNQNQTIEDAYARRFGNDYFQRLRQKSESNEFESKNNHFGGRARLRGSTWNRRNQSRTNESSTISDNSRRFSRRVGYSRYTHQKTNPNVKQTSAADRTYQKTRRLRMGSASGVKRTGPLTTLTNWSTESQERRNRSMPDYSKERPWKSVEQLNAEKLAERRAENKASFQPRRASLRQIWVGEREEASLDGQVND